jgi:hypothetical protein
MERDLIQYRKDFGECRVTKVGEAHSRSSERESRLEEA